VQLGVAVGRVFGLFQDNWLPMCECVNMNAVLHIHVFVFVHCMSEMSLSVPLASVLQISHLLAVTKYDTKINIID